MKTISILILVLAANHVFAQQPETEPLACDCPECQDKAASGDTGYTLAGLAGLNAEEEHNAHDHAEEAHEEPVDTDHNEPAEHDHDEEVVDELDLHEGHEHAEAGMGEIQDEMAEEVGIKVLAAKGGVIEKMSVFPTEIKLNRDRTAAVSPRYASVVRQVFAEIGDDVKKGDVLASLENRETLAVYTIAAPLDGVVIAKDLAVGETADADKVLYEVADLSTVWADISIFPQYQHLIKKDMRVELIAHDGHAAHGTVKYISPIVSHDTRTFTARCVLEGAGPDFTPGAFVRASIATETASVDVRVERAAIQSIGGETVVFISDGHDYEPVDVETGLADDHYVEIKQGLNPDDRYVAVGAFTLKAELITSGMDPHAGHNH